MLPKGEKLVENFYETKKLMKIIRLPEKKIHACKNHCMIFYGADSDLTKCRVCDHDRYKSGRRPYLVMRYLPIAPRLQRLYLTKKTAKQMKILVATPSWIMKHGVMFPEESRKEEYMDSDLCLIQRAFWKEHLVVYERVRNEMRDEMDAKAAEMEAKHQQMCEEMDAKAAAIDAKQQQIDAKYEAMEKMYATLQNMMGN
ncbi:unnamed protein product [Lactuca saligna]|uniref:Uncharacterized protein n=1 Tax=Lactuca saligna TaxID=75948 RepID=A0AA36E1Z2_LACSI|nr:unnamed protein product [Lactuca saligna]